MPPGEGGSAAEPPSVSELTSPLRGARHRGARRGAPPLPSSTGDAAPTPGACAPCLWVRMAWALKLPLADEVIESGLVQDFDASLSGIGQELGAGAYSMR